MRALRILGKSIIVLFAILGALTVALVIVAGIAVNHLTKLTAAPTPDKAVLVFDLANGVIDALPESPIARVALNKTVTLQDALRGIDAAASDDRIKGVILRLGSAGLDFVHAQELADAIASFRKSGKPVLAFAESFDEGGDTNSRYLLATSATQIWMQPSGSLSLAGASLQVPFLRDTLDKLGITARMDHREEYKGAMNSLTETSMPAPQRENMQALVDSLTGQLTAAIARNRQLDPAAAQKLVAGGPYGAEAAKDASLLDRLGYWDEAESQALSQAGNGAGTVELSDYIARLPDPPASAPKIAVIYGIGEVSLGRNRGSPLVGQSTMGARTIADALHEAVDDSKIAGIIFRIDSPGGSYVAADTIWREVDRARELKKPLVVSMGSLAASGGYFVAAPAATIVAEPGTLTGSIGVFGGKFVIKDLLAKLGINIDSVAGTANALAESMTKDYTPEQWAALEKELDRIYDDFMSKVAAGRHMDKAAVHAVAKGQVWTGADAQTRGLVDELGGLGTATAAVKRLAKIAPDAVVNLEQYPPPSNDLQSALASLTSGDSESHLLVQLMSRLAQIAAPLLSPDQTLRAPLP